jgi:DNA-binding beta-propeller fold protein YncE
MGTEIMLGGFGVSQPQDLAISPDGSTAYIVDLSSDRLYFYSLAADTVIGSVALPISSQNYGVIVSPDGSRVYVSNYSGNQISEYNVLTGAVSASTMGYSMPIGMAFYCPSRASGFCKKDTFLTQIDLINVVQWTPIVSNVPVEYLIYREGSLIGVVPDPGPYQFSDPNRKKNKPYLYSVFAKTSNNIAFVGNVTVTSCK